jgi:fluoroacetyl-CoA thioesterase
MKDIFKPGDKKQMIYRVKDEDVASFSGELVHPVCATFTLAREVEWATRQFVLEMRSEDEEGIGTFLSIHHKGPAFVGEQLVIESVVESIDGHELICSYIARVDDRLIAEGKTGQKIFKREKINALLTRP